MPPKRGETPEEKYARSVRFANEAMTKADYLRACMARKGRPEVIEGVKRHLKSIGMWDDVIVKKEKRKGAAKSDCSASDSGEVDADRTAVDNLDSAPVFDLTVRIHRNFGTWATVPPKHLQTILHMAEPVSLHARVLKCYCAPGQRVLPRQTALRFLEFIAGIDPSAPIPVDLLLQTIVEYVKERNERNGRRCRLTEHPVNWEKGAWTLIKMGDVVYLDKSFGSTGKINITFCLPEGTDVDKVRSRGRPQRGGL